LDLDDYNNDTEDGLHITSMAGTWMSVVKGFGGVQVIREKLSIAPYLPPNWTSFIFRIVFRKILLRIEINKTYVKIENLSNKHISFLLYNEPITINGGSEFVEKLQVPSYA